MKTIYRLSLVVIVLAITLMLMVFYCLFYPYNPLEVEEPMEVLSENVHGGDIVSYKVKFCKNTDKPATITRELVNDFHFTFSEVTVNNRIGCQEALLHIQIPDFAPAGEYKIRTTATYRMNTIREIAVVYESETFIVEE